MKGKKKNSVAPAILLSLIVGAHFVQAEIENTSTFDNCKVFEIATESETFDGTIKERTFYLTCTSDDKKSQVRLWVFDSQPKHMYFGLRIANFSHDNHPSKTMMRIRCKVDDKHIYRQTFLYQPSTSTAYWQDSMKEGNEKLDDLSKGKILAFEFEQKENKIFRKVQLKGVEKAIREFKNRLDTLGDK